MGAQKPPMNLIKKIYKYREDIVRLKYKEVLAEFMPVCFIVA